MPAATWWDSGYRDLVSVVPPGATLSPFSSLKPDQLGKTPGLQRLDGTWVGYNWLKHVPSREEATAWAGNIGLLAEHFPAVDIDCTDAALAAEIAEIARGVLGPAPARSGRVPKLLLMYRTEEPFARLALKLRKDGVEHLVEVLGQGRQYLVEGTHPSGVAYCWASDPPPATALTPITRDDAVRLLDTIAGAYELFGWEAERVGDGTTTRKDAPADQTSLRAPAPDALRGLIDMLPNDATTSREDYIRTGYAIKAAGGSCEEFATWAARHPDPAHRGDPETWRSDWGRMHPPFSVGWQWLCDQARGSGHSDAADDFADAPLPPPAGSEDIVAAARATVAGQEAAQVQAIVLATGWPWHRAERAWGQIPKPGATPPASRLLLLGDLYDHPELLEPPEALSDWFARRGEFVLLAGAKKDGKSSVARLDAISAMRRGHRILWVAAEEPRNVFAHWFAKMNAPREMPVLERPVSWEEMKAAIDTSAPDVVYIDTFHGFLNSIGEAIPEPYETAKWQALADRIRQIAGGRAVVLLHHMNKAGDATGSEGIPSATDTNIMMKRGREPDVRRFEVSSRWGNRTFALRWLGDAKPGYTSVQGVEEFARAKDDPYLSVRKPEGMALRTLAKAGAEGLSSGAWQERAGVPRSSFHRIRAGLEDRGWIAKCGETYLLTLEGREAAVAPGWVTLDGLMGEEELLE